MFAAEGGGGGSMNVLGPMGAGSGGGGSMGLLDLMDVGGAGGGMNMLGAVGGVGDPGSVGAGGTVAGGNMNIIAPTGTASGSGTGGGAGGGTGAGGGGGEGGAAGLSEAERMAWARTLGAWQIWSCPVCQKKFGMRYYYERHLKCHKAEKEHKCPYCPFRASYKWNLKSHIVNRHAGKPPPP